MRWLKCIWSAARSTYRDNCRLLPRLILFPEIRRHRDRQSRASQFLAAGDYADRRCTEIRAGSHSAACLRNASRTTWQLAAALPLTPEGCGFWEVCYAAGVFRRFPNSERLRVNVSEAFNTLLECSLYPKNPGELAARAIMPSRVLRRMPRNFEEPRVPWTRLQKTATLCPRRNNRILGHSSKISRDSITALSTL